MITNNSLFKLKNRESRNLQTAKELLMSMDGNIDILRGLQVEVDIRRSDSSYDILLITHFDTMKDFEIYISHPFHLEVAKHITEMLDSGISVCYES